MIPPLKKILGYSSHASIMFSHKTNVTNNAPMCIEIGMKITTTLGTSPSQWSCFTRPLKLNCGEKKTLRLQGETLYHKKPIES